MKIGKYFVGEIALDLPSYLSSWESLFVYSSGNCSHKHVMILFRGLGYTSNACSYFQKLASKQLDLNQQIKSDTAWKYFWARLPLNSTTFVYLSHLSPISVPSLSTSSWAEYPSAKLTSGMRLLVLKHMLLQTQAFSIRRFPNAPESASTPQSTRLCHPLETSLQEPLKRVTRNPQSLFPWIHFVHTRPCM